MREKPGLLRQEISDGRITPASAGKTRQGIHTTIQYQDHPRECGKNEEIMVKEEYRSGSPPRVREKRTLISPMIDEYRITPASAGKT